MLIRYIHGLYTHTRAHTHYVCAHTHMVPHIILLTRIFLILILYVLNCELEFRFACAEITDTELMNLINQISICSA